MNASILLKSFKFNKLGFAPLAGYTAGLALRIEYKPAEMCHHSRSTQSGILEGT
jgi:hypothetical protein